MREKFEKNTEVALIASTAVFVAATLLLLGDVVASGVFDVPLLSYGANSFVYALMPVSGFAIAVSLILFTTSAYEELSKPGGKLSGRREAIESDHGDDLTTVMAALREEEFEYLAVFDGDGGKIAEGTFLSPKTCSLTEEGWSELSDYDRMTVLHNHPSDLQMAFSSNDLHVQITNNFEKGIVVTRDCTYTMENPWWDRDDGPDADEVYDFARKMLDGSGAYGILFACIPECWSRYVSRRVARRFGLKFSVEDLRPKSKLRQAFATPCRRTVAASLAVMLITLIATVFNATAIEDGAIYLYDGPAIVVDDEPNNSKRVDEFGSGVCDPADDPINNDLKL